MALKSGALTAAELLALWQDSVDPSYGDPMVAAGDGNGLEAYTQMLTQMQRVSEAIDISTQAMYILPYSGQTNSPAQGEQNASVTLTLSRNRNTNYPIVLEAGLIVVSELTTDHGIDGAEVVVTGRRYVLQDTVIFQPGDSGPYDVIAQADRPGWGYNNPLPGTLSVFEQTGANFFNESATVALTINSSPPSLPSPPNVVALVTLNEADTFVPDQIGQYVLFTNGANAGRTGRIVGFDPPLFSATLQRGSTVYLEPLGSFEAFTQSGTLVVGETIDLLDGSSVVVAYARVGAVVGAKITYVLLSGDVSTATHVVGAMSAATATIDVVHVDPMFVAESGTADWRILDWVTDFGLTATNAESPMGGRLGYLDALGFERNIPRTPGETDESYRHRIATIADVVTPNAIRRTLNHALGELPWEFDEVGTSTLSGIFYDGDNSAPHVVPGGEGLDYYDVDCIYLAGHHPVAAIDSDCTATDTTLAITGGLALETARFILIENEIIWVKQVIDDATIIVVRGLWGSTPAIHLQDTPIYTYFEPNEPLHIYSASNLLKATGIAGTSTASLMKFVRRDGTYTTGAAGDYVQGAWSLSKFFIDAITDTIPPPRWTVYLDYIQFRAFFLVGVPRLALGEFGFAYDANYFPIKNAYDASPWNTFYDGFPTKNADFYLGIYNAVARVHAGGVGFSLFEL